jgi:integrase
MPLTLVPPRPSNPNYAIRGSYLHVKRLYRSTGTPEKRLAEQALRKLKRDIESGAFSPEVGPTFASAAMSYLRAGGETRFLGPLNEYFQVTPLDKINQAAIDLAATTIYPNADAATRNRQVYTPVSAILKHAGIDKELRRPKGARGKLRLFWLQPEALFKLFDAAETLEPRFGALCVFLFYTGCRLSEALDLKWSKVQLQDGFAYVGKTKNGDPRPVFLPPAAVATLANIPGDGKVFGYTKGRWVYRLLNKASEASGVLIPNGIAFHIFRHSYGALMRRHAGLDTSGLVATGAWKSHDAARIYEHVEFSEEATKAALLPTRKRV